MGKKKKHEVEEESAVYLEKLNWDVECRKDIITKRGFFVTEGIINKTTKKKQEIDEDEFVLDKKNARKATRKPTKAYGGIHSPRFATDFEDENAFEERYSCKCKRTKGRVYEGKVCPYCGTKVEFKDVDLSMTAWIRLKGHYIIQPSYYSMLESIIGRKVFPDIIRYDVEVDENGMVTSKPTDSNPFYGIGMIEFRNRFDEIMDYYFIKNKKKQDLIYEIRREKNKVFASNIPVYSSVLRQLVFTNESIKFTTIDRKYSTIYADSVLLTDADVRKKSKRKLATKDDSEILSIIQSTLVELWGLIFDQINQKKGHIKNQILGGRINFSNRSVIIPDPTLRADEIRISYLAFLELFKYEIIAHLCRMHDIPESQAFEEWSRATINFSPVIYEIMDYLVKSRKPKVAINRNPTINYGSLLTVKIVEVTREYKHDYTMSLPIQILRVLNADFDGDVLNVISFKTKELAKTYDANFNPRKNMYISRNDGLFNDDFNLFKDQIVGLNEFNNI